VQYVRVGYEISGASHQHEALLALQGSLRVELASLKSPERIEKIAKKQLGLVTPTPEQMIIIP
jgi:cell division protein FtsL